jgi:hypothetical protein
MDSLELRSPLIVSLKKPGCNFAHATSITKLNSSILITFTVLPYFLNSVSETPTPKGMGFLGTK